MAALGSFSFPKAPKGAAAGGAGGAPESRASGRLKNKGKVSAARVVDAATRLLVRKQRLAQLESDNYVYATVARCALLHALLRVRCIG